MKRAGGVVLLGLLLVLALAVWGRSVPAANAGQPVSVAALIKAWWLVGVSVGMAIVLSLIQLFSDLFEDIR